MLKQEIRGEQQLIMSYILRQALHILTLPQLELLAFLEKEIESNPLLEMNENTALSQEKREFLQSIIPYKPSIYEDLMRQATLIFSSHEDLKIASYIIGNIDDRGFFTLSLEKNDERVLERIQDELQPPGITARDLKECLLIQLKRQKSPKELAIQLIKHCFDDLLHGRFKQIERTLHLNREAIMGVIKRDITPLDPYPGKRFQKKEFSLAIPDLILDEIDGKWTIELASSSFVYVNETILKNASLTSEEKRALKHYEIRGKGLLNALMRREETLKTLGEFLIEKQRAFLKGDLPSPEPLSIKEAANALGLNPSTIARAIQHKMIKCPRGTLPLRQCFSQKVGDRISKEAAKLFLLNIIKKENKYKPLTDVILSKKLKEAGMPLARRTIAKYRKELKILNTLQRKE